RSVRRFRPLVSGPKIPVPGSWIDLALSTPFERTRCTFPYDGSLSLDLEGWQERSFIPHVGPHLSAEHPIRPARVGQDDRKQEQRSDQKECLGARRRGSLPQRQLVGHNHRKQADGHADVGQDEEADGPEKWRRLGLAAE